MVKRKLQKMLHTKSHATNTVNVTGCVINQYD